MRLSERDYTTQIKIGSEIFKIVKEKGKKVVLLPWQSLDHVLKDIDVSVLPDYKTLRGKILHEGFELFSGTKLNTLLALAKRVDIGRGVLRRWPRGTYTYSDSAEALCNALSKLLSPCARKKKSKKLGFLALYSDGQGRYWYRCAKGFHSALSESLSSLENLADEVAGVSHDRDRIETINATFRRLSSLLER